VPQLALKMQDAVQQVMDKGHNRTVDMAGLAALVAMRPRQKRAAVEAPSAMTVMAFNMPRLNRPADQPAGQHIAYCFNVPAHAAVDSIAPRRGKRGGITALPCGPGDGIGGAS